MFRKEFVEVITKTGMVPIKDLRPLIIDKDPLIISEFGLLQFKFFDDSRFAKSIAENYRKKKFVRGGSTISMQLVKNVFLSRHKTIARKAEEALIVWLIESNRIYSKERMFEVYLNIIELGPNIYGIGEA